MNIFVSNDNFSQEGQLENVIFRTELTPELSLLSIEDLLNKFDLNIENPIVGCLGSNGTSVHYLKYAFDLNEVFYCDAAFAPDYAKSFSLLGFIKALEIGIDEAEAQDLVIWSASGWGGNEGEYIISNILSSMGAIQFVLEIGIAIVKRDGLGFDLKDLNKYRMESRKWALRKLDQPINLWHLMHEKPSWTNRQLNMILSRKLSKNGISSFMNAFGFKWHARGEIWIVKKPNQVKKDFKKLLDYMSENDINDY